MNRRTFLKAGGVIAASGLGSFVYATGIEPHWLEIVTRDLPIDRLPAALDGLCLVQISDLHVGPRVSDDYIVHTFDRVRSLHADIITITGDFITCASQTDETGFGRLREVLCHLPHGRLATIGILGNHDYGRNWRQPAVAAKVIAEAERAGVRILRNETEAVNGLDIIGVDDLWSGRADAPAALRMRSTDAALALVHNPDAADRQPWPEYEGWMLAGHTHGGQCKAPFLPPPLLPVENRRYVAGEVMVDSRRTLYINRGVGHQLRARFNVRPEVTMFTLRARAANSTESLES